MEKEIDVNGKKFVIKEIKYKDLVELGSVSPDGTVDNSKAAKALMLKSTDMTDDQYNELSMKEGIEIQKSINELNGIGQDFLKPLTKQEVN